MNMYYIIVNNNQQGPFTVEELREKHIHAHTMVWREGFAQWIPAGQVPELREAINDASPLNPTGIPPKTWLLESILATILCCLPLGIVGIVYAAKVETHYYAGRYEEARRCSQTAKTWTLLSVFCIVFSFLLYAFIFVFGFGAVAMTR